MKFVFFFSLAVLIPFARGAERSLLPEDQALIHELCQMSEQGNVCLQRQKVKAVERVVEMITQAVPEEERAVSFAAMLRVEGPEKLCENLGGIELDNEQIYQVLKTLVERDKEALSRRYYDLTVFDILVFAHRFDLLGALLAELYEREWFLPLETLETLQWLLEREQAFVTDAQRTQLEGSLKAHRQARIEALKRSFEVPNMPMVIFLRGSCL